MIIRNRFNYEKIIIDNTEYYQYNPSTKDYQIERKNKLSKNIIPCIENGIFIKCHKCLGNYKFKESYQVSKMIKETESRQTIKKENEYLPTILEKLGIDKIILTKE